MLRKCIIYHYMAILLSQECAKCWLFKYAMCLFNSTPCYHGLEQIVGGMYDLVILDVGLKACRCLSMPGLLDPSLAHAGCKFQPPKITMLLNILEPPRWSLGRCLVRVLRGSNSCQGLAQPWLEIGRLKKLDIWHGDGHQDIC